MYCGCDPEYYVELEPYYTSQGTLFCCECRCLIPAGEECWHIREYQTGWDGEEVHKAYRVACDKCGDLIESLLQLGYCWGPGTAMEVVQAIRLEW